MWDGSPFAGFLSLREVWRHTEVGSCRRRQLWDGSPFAGFLSLREVWRHTEVGYVRTARSRVNDEETPQSLPRGARMILKYYSDKEAVQSRE